MTREEAIKNLEMIRIAFVEPVTKEQGKLIDVTIDMAISALSENKGEWIKVHSGDKDFPESIVCSKCGNENSHFDFNEHAEPIGKVFVTSKFCPNCGADMKGD